MKDYTEKVFIAIFTKHAKPYINYKCKKVNQNENVPMLLMIERWDGKKGFPGGTVEDKSPSEDTIKLFLEKELKEEINYNLEKEVVKIKKTKMKRGKSHLFVLEVSYEELLSIQKDWMNAEHAHSEICGVNIHHISNYSKSNLLNGSFSGCAKEELEYVINYMEA